MSNKKSLPSEEELPPIRKLVILAGAGNLPLVALEEALQHGLTVLVYLASGGEEQKRKILTIFQKYETPEPSQLIRVISASKVGALVKNLKKDEVTHMVILGKIEKKKIFREGLFDATTLKLIAKARDLGDTTIFSIVAREIEKAGVEILPQQAFLEPLLLAPGVYSRTKPNREEREIIDYGMLYARRMGDLDIGQTIVAGQKMILAVEAVEGTDEAIRRGGALAGKKRAIVCKAQRKRQDPRFDIPTVGLDTIAVMKESGCRGLAIEARKTFVVDPENFIKEINRLGMIFVVVQVPQAMHLDKG